MIEFAVKQGAKKKTKKLFNFRIWTDDKRLGWVKYNIEVMDFQNTKIHHYTIKYPRRLEREAWLPYLALQRFATEVIGAKFDKYK
jgi:hypothetical protein